MPKTASQPGKPFRGHPIAVVAERTGLSREVLRVWERRYAAVEPDRSAGGQRLYSDDQVNRFRLLAAATKHGRSPAADIVAAASASDADAVVVSVVHTDNPASVVRELHAVRGSLPAAIPVIAGGAAAVRMARTLAQPGLVVCESIADMRRVLAREGAAA